MSFQCRQFLRTATFIRKIYYNQAPINLYKQIAACVHPIKARITRSTRPLLAIPQFQLSSCGDRSFQYFSALFINAFFVNSSHNLHIFKANLVKIIDESYQKFTNLFMNFDIQAKSYGFWNKLH